jgi:hypothetical protein
MIARREEFLRAGSVRPPVKIAIFDNKEIFVMPTFFLRIKQFTPKHPKAHQNPQNKPNVFLPLPAVKVAHGRTTAVVMYLNYGKNMVLLHHICNMEYTMELKPQGSVSCPIWLIGDSDPKNWVKDLCYVFDDRHPTIHNIWTPIVYAIQKKYCYDKHKMFDDSKIYIDNAIHNPNMRPDKNQLLWDTKTVGKKKAVYLKKNMEKLKNLIETHNPEMIITFGSFAFEFVKRCIGGVAEKTNHWSTKNLKDQFDTSVTNVRKVVPLLVPLLHRSISMGRFVSSHKYFTGTDSKGNKYGNYFEYVSNHLYPKFKDIFLKLN